MEMEKDKKEETSESLHQSECIMGILFLFKLSFPLELLFNQRCDESLLFKYQKRQHGCMNSCQNEKGEGANQEQEYLTKWEGYPAAHDTWEKEETFNGDLSEL